MDNDELVELKVNIMKNLNISQKFLLIIDIVKILPYNYMKFLNTILNDNLTNPQKQQQYNCAEFKIFEEQANDIRYIELLEEKSNEDLIHFLITYLPLVNCIKLTNEAKNLYKSFIERIIQTSAAILNFHNNSNYEKEYKQLISMLKIHPLFSSFTFDSTTKVQPQQLQQQQQHNSNLLCINNCADEAYVSMQSLDTSALSLNTQLKHSIVERTESAPPSLKQNGNYVNANLNTSNSKLKAAFLATITQQANSGCSGSGSTINDFINSLNSLHCEELLNGNSLKNTFQQNLSNTNLSSDDSSDNNMYDLTNNSVSSFTRSPTRTPIPAIITTSAPQTITTTPISTSQSPPPLLTSSPKLSLPMHTPLGKRVSAPSGTQLNSHGFGTNFRVYQSIYGGSTSSIYMAKDDFQNQNMFSSGSIMNCNTDSSDNINTFTTAGSGMKDVPVWLKGLRLHKYTSIFSKMTYSEMMSLNEKQLREQNVTSGATNKILTQIQKLKERNKRLVQILNTSDLSDANVLDAVLLELIEMSFTPMKPFDTNTNGNHVTDNDENRDSSGDDDGDANVVNDDDHLTDTFIKLLETIHEELLNMYNSSNKDRLYSNYIQLIDKLFKNGSFSDLQKELMKKWRSKLCELNNHLKFNFISGLKPKTKRCNKSTLSINQDSFDQLSSINGTYNKARSNWSSQYDVNQQNNSSQTITSSIHQQQQIQHRKLEKTYSYPTRSTATTTVTSTSNFNTNNLYQCETSRTPPPNLLSRFNNAQTQQNQQQIFNQQENVQY